MSMSGILSSDGSARCYSFLTCLISLIYFNFLNSSSSYKHGADVMLLTSSPGIFK